MAHAIVIDIFNDVEQSTKLINTNEYTGVVNYGSTIIPCLPPEEIYNMYAAGYTDMNENKKKIIYLDNKKTNKTPLRSSARGCWKTR